MQKFISTKVYDGYSACFRQWRAIGTHCRFVHSYGVSIVLGFDFDIDKEIHIYKNIEGSINSLLSFYLNRTFLVAEDDPCLEDFKALDSKCLDLRILPQVGCERFAEFLFHNLNNLIGNRITYVEVKEHDKNSGIYIGCTSTL